ncbi:hypothetical protein ScPMuIL_017942 [Solemya velum]
MLNENDHLCAIGRDAQSALKSCPEHRFFGSKAKVIPSADRVGIEPLVCEPPLISHVITYLFDDFKNPNFDVGGCHSSERRTRHI